MATERRFYDRKDLDPLAIEGIIAIADLNPIADHATLLEASPSGFRIEISRKNLSNEPLKSSINLKSIEGLEISLFIPAMELDITGIIVRSRYKGENVFELGIDYTSDAPEYWRQCLVDLLPIPGEMAS